MGTTSSSKAPQPEEDGALIQRSLATPTVFGLIFARHFDTIYSYLARRAGRETAEDLAAQTFVIAFERRSDFQLERHGALPWLYGIATNLLHNHRRRAFRHRTLLARMFTGTPSIDDNVQEIMEAHVAKELVDQLDSNVRDVLLLFAWADLSYREISVSLGIPLGTVASRLDRGRRALRAAVDEHYQEVHNSNIIPRHTTTED